MFAEGHTLSPPTPHSGCWPIRGLWKIQEALALLCCQATAGEVLSRAWHMQGPGGEGLGPVVSHSGEGEMGGPCGPGPGLPEAAAEQPSRLKTRLMEVRAAVVRDALWGWVLILYVGLAGGAGAARRTKILI